MIVNPGKFQVIITDKRKQDHANKIFKIGSKEIKVASQVKLQVKFCSSKISSSI